MPPPRPILVGCRQLIPVWGVIGVVVLEEAIWYRKACWRVSIWRSPPRGLAIFSPKICWGELQLMCSQCSLFWIGRGDRDIGAGNVIRDLLRGISLVICSVVCCYLPYPDFKSLNPESPKSRFVLQKNFSPRRWPSVCHRFPRWIPTFQKTAVRVFVFWICASFSIH